MKDKPQSNLNQRYEALAAGAVPSPALGVDSGKRWHADNAHRDVQQLFKTAYEDRLSKAKQIWVSYFERCEESYLAYLDAIDQCSADSQNRCHKAQNGYESAVRLAHGSNASFENIEQAYCSYMRAVLEVWDFEEVLQQSKKAHRIYREALQSSQSRASLETAHNRYRRELREGYPIQMPAQFLDAYENHVQALENAYQEAQKSILKQHCHYVEAMHRIWAALDLERLDASSVEEITGDMAAAALQPVLYPGGLGISQSDLRFPNQTGN
jgi:flagellar biosynthesis chaperone FliJ